jgi:hypothetical protein
MQPVIGRSSEIFQRQSSNTILPNMVNQPPQISIEEEQKKQRKERPLQIQAYRNFYQNEDIPLSIFKTA